MKIKKKISCSQRRKQQSKVMFNEIYIIKCFLVKYTTNSYVLVDISNRCRSVLSHLCISCVHHLKSESSTSNKKKKKKSSQLLFPLGENLSEKQQKSGGKSESEQKVTKIRHEVKNCRPQTNEQPNNNKKCKENIYTYFRRKKQSMKNNEASF